MNDTVIDNTYLDANVATLAVLGATVGSPAIINTAGGGRIVFWRGPDVHHWEMLTQTYDREPLRR